MACTSPVTIRRPLSARGEGLGPDMVVPCGRCVGCSLDYGRMWSVRCYHESLLHRSSLFCTFTLDDDHLHHHYPGLPASLDPLHLTLFFKRLRQHFPPKSIRYFACAEYGTHTFRPHYHAIIFGLELLDLEPLSKGLSESSFLNSVWGLGKVAVGTVTPESIAYCCRYTVKKVLGRPRQWYLDRGLIPEFVRMSRRPGIGADFFAKYRDDIYNFDSCWLPSGFKAKVPRYYDKLLDASYPDFFVELKESRRKQALARGEVSLYHLEARDVILRSRLDSSSDAF